jgi:hypothetical protein
MVRPIGLRCVSFRDGARRSVGSSGRRPGLLDDICCSELAPDPLSLTLLTLLTLLTVLTVFSSDLLGTRRARAISDMIELIGMEACVSSFIR